MKIQDYVADLGFKVLCPVIVPGDLPSGDWPLPILRLHDRLLRPTGLSLSPSLPYLLATVHP